MNTNTYENNGIEVAIDGNGTLWFNERHIKEKLESSQTQMTQTIKCIDMN